MIADVSFPFSAFRNFSPFTIGAHTFTGVYDPGERLGNEHDLAYFLDDMSKTILQHKSQQVRAPKTGSTTYHGGIAGEITLSLEYINAGGQPWTYGDCIYAVQDLITGVLARPHLSAHPAEILIFQGEIPRLRCTVVIDDSGEGVVIIIPGLPFKLDGDFYYARRLPAAGVQNAIGALISQLQRYPAGRAVPNNFLQMVTRGSVDAVLNLYAAPGAYHPFTFGQLTDLMSGVRTFFPYGGNWGELYVDIFHQAAGQTTFAGYLEIRSTPFSVLDGTTNATSQVAVA